MINNKKGLSDIVTTVLIILLVAVAVAAVWAFVAPSLSGTGKQFTKTQVCISNIIEPITCETDGRLDDGLSAETTGTDFHSIAELTKVYSGSAPYMFAYNPATEKEEFRSPYADGTNGKDDGYPLKVRVRRTLSDGVTLLQEYKVEATAARATEVETESPGFLGKQGTTTAILMRETAEAAGTEVPINHKISGNAQVKVISTYSLPDGTIVPCESLPILCSDPDA